MHLKLLNKINLILLIMSYFYFSYIKIFLSLPYHLFFLIIGVVLNLHRFKYVYKSLDKRLVVLFLMMIAIFYKSYIMQTGLFPNFTYLSRYVFIEIAIIYYIVAMIRDESDIKFFEKVIILVSIISIATAILQYLQFDLGWEIRKFIDFNPSKLDAISIQITDRIRPMGLAYFSITYSYQMLIISSFIFSYFIINKNSRNIFLLLFGFFSLFVSLTKSSLFGFTIAILIVVFYQKVTLKKILILSTFFLCIIILWYNQNSRNFLDVSSLSRLYLFNAGFNVFLDFFITGTGSLNYINFTKLYMEEFGLPFWITEMSVHNSYLAVLIKHGFLVIFPIVYLYYIYFLNNIYLKRYNYRLYIFFFVYIIAYTFNSFFHNAGIFNGDQLFWLIFAYLLVSNKIYKKKKMFTVDN